MELVPLLSVLSVSLMGSGHCASMCGGFSFIASRYGSITKGLALYHLGRLLAYLVLGIAVGVMSQLVDKHTMIPFLNSKFIGGISLAYIGYRVLRPRKREHRSEIRGIFLTPTFKRFFPFMLGLTSGFLPCGWLYAFLAVAFLAGDAPSSVAVMIVFWVGTLPILTLVGSSAQFVDRFAQLRTPWLRALLLFIAAIYSLTPAISAAFVAESIASAPSVTCH